MSPSMLINCDKIETMFNTIKIDKFYEKLNNAAAPIISIINTLIDKNLKDTYTIFINDILETVRIRHEYYNKEEKLPKILIEMKDKLSLLNCLFGQNADKKGGAQVTPINPQLTLVKQQTTLVKQQTTPVKQQITPVKQQTTPGNSQVNSKNTESIQEQVKNEPLVAMVCSKEEFRSLFNISNSCTTTT